MASCRRYFILFLALPFLFGAETTKKRRSSEETSNIAVEQVIPLAPVITSCPVDSQDDYSASFQAQAKEFQTYLSEISSLEKLMPKRKLNELKTQSSFDYYYYQDLTRDGLYHKLPAFRVDFADCDPSDYLALAIRAHDAQAIDSCKNFVALNCASSYLQCTLIDSIVKDEADIMDALGKSFPLIFTNIYAFHPPYSHLSGTSFIRIAVDQERSKAARTMLKFIPVAMIGDLWHSIDSMKKFILGALHCGEINLTPRQEGDTGLTRKVLIEMYYACVIEGDVEAMVYLLENSKVDIKTMFTGTNGVSISAMFIAAHTGHYEIVSYLYKKCPELAKIPNSMGMLPIHMAAGNGHMDVIKILSAEADTLTAEVTINGINYTPFSLAIRNKKRNIADLIISFIRDKDNSKIQKEMTGLAYWAILDDNVGLLDIYFEFNTFPSSGCVDEEYNLLEMAILGIINPKRTISPKKTSSKNCLIRLIDEWKKHNLPFRIHHEGVISGNILGLVNPNDLFAFQALFKQANIDLNAPIFITTKRTRNSIPVVLRTTFINHVIGLGASEMVPFAISKGCDPRILDSDGNDAIEIARKHNNIFVLNYFNQLYPEFAV